jgi:hypothetical protein
MDTKIHFELGFKMDGIFFGWHDRKLYQLPYVKDGRYYGLRVLREKKLKNGWVYFHVRRKKVGMEKLRAMLQTVTWETTKPQSI